MCKKNYISYPSPVIPPLWMRRWLTVVAVVTASVCGTTFLSSPAVAASGDASTVGFDANFTGELVGGTGISVVDQKAAVAAPPDASAVLSGAETLIDVDLGAPAA